MTAECFASDNVRNDKAMGEIIKVGMADLKVCVSPDGLTTLGLGSCVGMQKQAEKNLRSLEFRCWHRIRVIIMAVRLFFIRRRESW